MAIKLRDLTPIVDLTLEKGTGPLRARHPVYGALRSPCNAQCPAGEDVQGWLALVRAGEYRQAWELLVRDNPFPAIHGRVCYHPCESACNRGLLDVAVGIHAVERYLGDLATRERWPFRVESPASGRRVLVVGSGPSGLAAAYHLVRRGHAVEVREAAERPGGMMRFGIPEYRLPRRDLAREIERIEAMGVRIVCRHRVDDVLAEKAEGFDAVYLAIGAGISKHIDVPARDAARVIDAVGLLHDVTCGEPPRLGRRVVVYGGGNTAMDAARTAKRLGAEDALIIYRRDRSHMAAHAFEVAEAMEEGVRVKWLTTIRDISGPELTIERMEIDADGRPRPTGELETLPADALVLAVGQETESGFLRALPGIERDNDGAVQVGPDMMTGVTGVFAGGDMIVGERSVTVAVGQGKKAAGCIDSWLRGESVKPAPQPQLASFDRLRLPLYADVRVIAQQVLPPAQRAHGFAEVVAGVSQAEAAYEAGRCLSCGHCFECDGCYAACPQQAILKLGVGQGYRIDYERCTGCAVCVEQCPVHAMEMVPEGSPWRA